PSHTRYLHCLGPPGRGGDRRDHLCSTHPKSAISPSTTRAQNGTTPSHECQTNSAFQFCLPTKVCGASRSFSAKFSVSYEGTVQGLLGRTRHEHCGTPRLFRITIRFIYRHRTNAIGAQEEEAPVLSHCLRPLVPFNTNRTSGTATVNVS